MQTIVNIRLCPAEYGQTDRMTGTTVYWGIFKDDKRFGDDRCHALWAQIHATPGSALWVHVKVIRNRTPTITPRRVKGESSILE